MYHLGYIVCIRSVCILQLHTRTTPPDHRARNRQNNQPDSRRPSVVSSVHGGAGWQKINCSFLQYWNYHKKSREKQTVFVWKLFCDRRLIYLHFETDEWTWVATTGPHSITVSTHPLEYFSESTMSDFSPGVRLDSVFSFKPHLTFFVRKQKRNEMWFVKTNARRIHNLKIFHSCVYTLK